MTRTVVDGSKLCAHISARRINLNILNCSSQLNSRHSDREHETC